MKAAWFEKFGAASDVMISGQLPDPEPSEGEVLVEIKTSAVNPSDVKKRAGAFPALLDDGFVIPNSDGTGVIVAVGKGVSGERVGDRVWVYQAQFDRRMGSAAELLAIDSRRAVCLPENSSFEEGACMGIPAMTAHRCVFADGPVGGKSLLVTGGAGRVGFYAIQWASQAGARVVTTASCEEDRQACLAAGAHAVIDHYEADWYKQALEENQPEKFDRVIDVEFGANLPQTLELIRTGGTIASYSSTQEPQPVLPFLRMMYLDLSIRMVIVYAMPEAAKQKAAADIEKALQENRLQHRIAHCLPLYEIARANELIEEGGFRGSVILSVS